MQELAEVLSERGYNVMVATVYPQHNLSQDIGRPFYEPVTNENGIKVLRIKTLPSHMVNYIVRGISYIVLPHIFFLNIRRYFREKIDTAIVYSPPLSLSIVGSKLKKVCGAKFILNVQDIFPQNAIDLGILKNNFAIKYFLHMERNAYSEADSIAVHSDSNAAFLSRNKKVQQDRVAIIHNWIDITPYEKAKRTGRFRKLMGLEDKFVLLFAGVIGPSQGLDLLIEAADRLRHLPDIRILIVGDGMEKERLKKKAAHLTNVIFWPFVSKEEYPELVKDADVGVVCLSSMNKTPVVPGKILGYMAASVPIVAFLNKESDGHEIIRSASCGYSEISDDPSKAAELLCKVYSDRDTLRQLGDNGFRYASMSFTRKKCIDKLEELF
ncbi:MAG: glycosyltransferase family 4 protein [Nitrospirae bacterium]|nr:glycosyltransferase family 4 protein [Nitrospirota bacterium]